MIVKKLLKKIALSVILLSFCTLRANGAEPGFSIYPNGGQVVKPQEGFIVDIEIDSGGRAIVNAKFTLLFDPAVLQLVKAERNNTLFQAWPEDESTLDNENGVVMLTGVAQSRSVTGADGKEVKEYTPYKSSTPDIIARLHFKVLKEAKTTLDWEFNTNNGVFDTTMNPKRECLIPKRGARACPKASAETAFTHRGRPGSPGSMTDLHNRPSFHKS